MSTRTRTSPLLTATCALGAALAISATPAQAQSSGPVDPDRVGCIWERHADSPIARFEAGTLPIDGKLYCFGGFFNQAIQASARVDAYDPQTDAWTRMADMPTNVTHCGFVREGRNVWVLGGFVGDNPGTATSEVWIYDIDANAWSVGPALPRPIASGGAALFGTDLHYYGGCEADRDTMTGDHWVLDITNQAAGWQPRASMPEPRCHLAGAVLGGEIWAVGGQFNHDTNPTDTRFVHAYDPVLDTWRAGPLMPEPRSHFEPGTFVEGGLLYISGGKDLTSGREILSDVLELDPVLETWSYVPPLPNARYGPGAQLIGGRLYAANGAALGNDPQTDLYSRDFAADFPNPFRINCGGPEVMAAVSGTCWCGDIGAQNGRSRPFNPAAEILGTDDDEVFDRQRESQFPNGQPVVYRVPMGNGAFRVKFHLSERATMTPGQRLLTLFVEGQPVAVDLDLALDPGFQVALERGFDVVVNDSRLDISIDAPAGQSALVAALEIERLPPDHIVTYCPNGANSTGQPAVIRPIGTTSVSTNQLELAARPVPANQFGLFVQGVNAGNFQLPGGGTLCIGTPFYRLAIVQADGDTLRHQLELQSFPQPGTEILAGATVRFQAWYRDPTGPTSANLSNGLRLQFTQ